MTHSIKHAMQNLLSPKYRFIHNVFGRVLVSRSKQNNPECSLLRLLSESAHPSELLNEDCKIYVRELGITSARKKCEKDLSGQVRRPAPEFNGVCGDFWAEIAAIRTLSQKGYTRFRPIYEANPTGATSDYEAEFEQRAAYVEVKNMRMNTTVLDIFDAEIRRLYSIDPDRYGLSIEVRYPYDDYPNKEQERAIRNFVIGLRDEQKPHKESLDLGASVAQIIVNDGYG